MTSSNENEPPKKIPIKFKLFKLYDFIVYDGYSKQTDFDKSNFEPYKDNKKFIIQMFGINSSGQTGSILVEDFNPFFYIKVGDNWTDSTRTEFVGHIKKKMGNYYEDSIVESKLIKRKKLYGFDDHKLHNFVRISFTNNGAFNKAKKIFFKDTIENGYFNRELIKDGYIYQNTNCYLYEANIPPLLKLFHLQEISPSGWVLLPSNKVKTVNKKTTHCAYEYIISHKYIKKAEKDDIVKYNICSFDIEASSSHGDFPVPIKDYKKLATNILQHYNELQEKQNYNIKLFEKQISAAFGYEDINYIDKVYPKLKQISKEQLNNIFDNFIKYIPANDKNRKDYTLEIEESDSESDNDDEPIEFIKKVKNVKKYNKNANIFEIITDDKCEYETKLLELNKALTKFYPQLEGDIVTFIGMTFINYSEKKPYIRYIIVKGGCKIPDKYKQWVQENYVKIIEKPNEKGVLLEFTKIMQLENPHIVTGYNINGFDWDFMYKRAKEIGCVHDFLKLSRNKDEVCINKDWRTGEEDIAKNKIILASGEYNLSYVDMPGRIIIDMCVIFRREFTLSSNKLDYVSSYFISDSVKKIQINKTNNTTEIFSTNLTGLTCGCFVKFEEISHSVNSYKKGKKFEVLTINLTNASFTINGVEELDLINYKINWGLAKDDVSPQEIFELANKSDFDRFTVGKYCLGDCDNVIWLLLKIDVITDKVEMSNLCDVPLNFLLLRGQGIKLQSYVSKKCGEKNTLMPVIEKELADDGYEGAHVFNPKTGLYLEDPVACVDYSSLYPSSMISENLSHDSKVWTKEYDLSGNLINSTGIQDKDSNYIYDNLPNYSYVDVKYDTYKYSRTSAKSAAKKIVVGYKICRFAQFPEGKAIMPAILEELLGARKATKKLMAKEEDPFKKNIYDKRQLSIKVTANSLYGQCGAKTSAFYEKDVAASTTATGRKLLFYGKDVIEGCYDNIEITVSDGSIVKTKAECVYGDSVMGYTPIYIKINNKIEALTIEELGEKYGKGWYNCLDEGKEEKLYCNLKENIKSWTNNGWTKLERIIKHKLHSSKNIIRVLTHTGLVDVTDDHSLLRDDETIISPKNIEIGTKLLHKTLILDNNENKSVLSIEEAKIMGFFFGNGSCCCYDCPSGKKASWALNNSSEELFRKYLNLCEKVYPMFEWKVYNTLKSSGVNKLSFNSDKFGEKKRFIENYRNKMYYKNSKIIPEIILNSNREIREAFWEGLYDADGYKKSGNIRIDQKNQLSASHICLLANSLDYKTSINTRTDKINVYRINCTKSYQRKCCDCVKKIINITETLNEEDRYVYDLTTENHHFAAGIGNIIVHNTDSVFFKFNLKTTQGKRIINKQALIYTIELAKQAGELATKFLKKPHDLEYEKTFWPFNLLSKKRYDGMLYEEDPEKCKLKSMGNVLKRRDNAPIVKDIYGGVVNILMKDKSLPKSIKFVNESLQNMIEEKYPIEKLLVTKSLRGYYKNPKQIAHKVLADRIGLREQGNKPGAGDRINYAYIKNDNKKALQGEKIETPEFIKNNNLKLDFGHYISNQIMKPLLQLFALELENIKEFKEKQFYIKEYNNNNKKTLTWEQELEKLKTKWPEPEKFAKKYEELRCKEVKSIIFDKFLKDLK
jgi:DNA polymerase elongation subunit (family B)